MDKQVGLLICLLGGVGMEVGVIFALNCCWIWMEYVVGSGLLWDFHSVCFSFFPPPMKITNSVIWKRESKANLWLHQINSVPFVFDSYSKQLEIRQLVVCSFKHIHWVFWVYFYLNPFTPKIYLVILLTISHTILMMLVQRIWYWIN